MRSLIAFTAVLAVVILGSAGIADADDPFTIYRDGQHYAARIHNSRTGDYSNGLRLWSSSARSDAAVLHVYGAGLGAPGLHVTGDNKVGIGRGPTAKLDVAGTIHGDEIGVGTPFPEAPLTVRKNIANYVAKIHNTNTSNGSGGLRLYSDTTYSDATLLYVRSAVSGGPGLMVTSGHKVSIGGGASSDRT